MRTGAHVPDAAPGAGDSEIMTCHKNWAAYDESLRKKRTEQFTALIHHVDVALLKEAFLQVREDAAPGVDGVTRMDYERDLERNLKDLHVRVHRGTYRALPSRRGFIHKHDGRERPLASGA